MLRFIQMLFLALVAGPAEAAPEALEEQRWRVRNLDRSLSGYARHWDGLNRELLAGHPMLDSRFVDALLRHFGDGSEKLCQLERDGSPVGMCILKRERPGVWRSFVPPQAQIAPAILPESGGLPGLLAEIPGLVGQVDLLCQDPEFSPALHGDDMPLFRKPHVLTMSVRTDGSFEDYWASRPKKLQSSLRTRENRLAKAGLVPRVVPFSRPEEMAGVVERFAGLEMAGWKGRAGTAVTADGIQGRFYTEVMERFAETGQGLAYEYWLGDRLAASQLALAGPGMIILLKTAYDEEMAQYSPGRLLLREVLRDGFARMPGGVIEFYTNANSDQLAWATDQRWIEHISLYRNRVIGQVIGAVKATRRFAQGLSRKEEPREAEEAA